MEQHLLYALPRLLQVAAEPSTAWRPTLDVSRSLSDAFHSLFHQFSHEYQVRHCRLSAILVCLRDARFRLCWSGQPNRQVTIRAPCNLVGEASQTVTSWSSKSLIGGRPLSLGLPPSTVRSNAVRSLSIRGPGPHGGARLLSFRMLQSTQYVTSCSICVGSSPQAALARREKARCQAGACCGVNAW